MPVNPVLPPSVSSAAAEPRQPVCNELGLEYSDRWDGYVGLGQFGSGALEVIAHQTGYVGLGESLRNICVACNWYRSITRLQGLYVQLQQVYDMQVRDPGSGSFPRWLAWYLDTFATWTEAVSVLASWGIIRRSERRKAQLISLTAWFYFWKLLAGQLRCLWALFRLYRRRESTRRLREEQRNRFLIHLLWWLVVWGCQPRDGSRVQLLEHPQGSLLRPLHLLVEMLTVKGLMVDSFTMNCLAFLAVVRTLRLPHTLLSDFVRAISQ
eukprot:Hpha_TRINITY_DN20809_c0_g1::TRINITY_DN20809_c0_g1_i1::g.85706::m.85706